MDLVGPTLQSLKKLLENVPSSPHEKEKFERIVHGILSACLVNIDAMRLVRPALISSSVNLITLSEVAKVPPVAKRSRATFSRPSSYSPFYLRQ